MSSEINFNKDYAGPAQSWCPYCNTFYPTGTEHTCKAHSSIDPGSTGAGGYICPNCGMWVNYGESHFCGGFGNFPDVFPKVTELSPRQEKKLDRMIQLLEAVVEKLIGSLPEQEEDASNQ